MKATITIEEASKICKERFSVGTTKRSEAYQAGFGERLQRVATQGKHKFGCPFSPGSADFDAWFSGFDHAETSINVFVMRKEEG